MFMCEQQYKMSSSESEQNLQGCCDPDLKVGYGHQK